MTRLFRAALAAFLLSVWGAPALAAPQCDGRAALLEMLASTYQEAPVALGVTNNGGLVEVLATGDGGTWSIIVTTPQGGGRPSMSCLVAAGENWKSVKQLAQEPKA